MNLPKMNFCSQCGHTVSTKIPPGDDHMRHVCDHCQTIHYHNPKIIAGCLVTHQDKVLLCKRAIEPRYGLWTLPAGFMENGESVEQAALRETWEEAAAKPILDSLYRVFSLPHISQVYMIYRATLEAPVFGAGTESLEVELMSEQDIPWDHLAFQVMHRTLTAYFDDKKRGEFPVASETILASAKKY